MLYTFWFWVRPMATSADMPVVTLRHKRALPVALVVATTYGSSAFLETFSTHRGWLVRCQALDGQWVTGF